MILVSDLIIIYTNSILILWNITKNESAIELKLLKC